MPPIEYGSLVEWSIGTLNKLDEGEFTELICPRDSELATHARITLDPDNEGGNYTIRNAETGRLTDGNTLYLMDIKLVLRGGTEEQLKEKSYSFFERKIRR